MLDDLKKKELIQLIEKLEKENKELKEKIYGKVEEKESPKENQDTMPKGGFGNLIALPFQGESSI